MGLRFKTKPRTQTLNPNPQRELSLTPENMCNCIPKPETLNPKTNRKQHRARSFKPQGLGNSKRNSDAAVVFYRAQKQSPKPYHGPATLIKKPWLKRFAATDRPCEARRWCSFHCIAASYFCFCVEWRSQIIADTTPEGSRFFLYSNVLQSPTRIIAMTT